MGRKYIIEIIGGEEGDMDFSTIEPYTEPDMEQVKKEAYEEGKKQAKVQAELDVCHDIEKVAKGNYKAGLSDAWDAARKIIRMPEGDLLNLFTECYSAVCTSVQVFLKYDASECIEKIRQYEQRQEEDGLRHNIQTIVDQCGYSLDEIAEVLAKMKEASDG